MRSNLFRIFYLVVMACLSACVSDSGQHDADWRNGAKHGWISGFYTAATPRSELPKCLSDLSAEELANHRYVKVDYWHGRRVLIEAAELPELGIDQRSVKIGDRVELWPHNCYEGHLSRISKIMPVPSN